MFLIVENVIRGRNCQGIHRYTKANNKYMKNYDKSIESSYIVFLDANNLYGWAMSQKLPVNGFKWAKNLSEFNEDFIKNYDENSDKGYFLEEDVAYSKKLSNSHRLTISTQKKKVEKVKKLICSIEDKEKYVIHVRDLKQALNHGLKPKKVHRVSKFNQRAWLKPYIDMNTELRTNAENEFEKDFFKVMNNSVFGKTLGNEGNHLDIKLVASDKRRKRLVSKPNYLSHKNFSEHLMAIEMKKRKPKLTKPRYLGMSILDVNKTLMYEVWYDYIKPEYGDRAKLCHMDSDSFVINIIIEDFFEDISNYVERWFDTSTYDENDKRPLPIGKN